MDIDVPKTIKVVIPLKKRKIEVDPLNIDINLGVSTPFISKKNKNTSSLLEKAKNTLKEALEIEKKDKKKENISKLIISLENIILNKKERDKEEKEREKEEEKDNIFNISLKEEILELKERISKVSNKIDTFSINSLKPTINSSNNSNIITITNKTNTQVEVLKKNKNKEKIIFPIINTPKKSINNIKKNSSFKN